MSISSRFAVGIHILSLLVLNKDSSNSSEQIAASVNTNPVVIRKIMGMLKNAELIHVRPGIAGAELAKDYASITLLDVYKAVNVVPEKELFGVHNSPNPACLVGRNIQNAVDPLFISAQLAMEQQLAQTTLKDVIENIESNENG